MRAATTVRLVSDTIEEQWQEFLRQNYRTGTDPESLALARKLFFAGACGMFNILGAHKVVAPLEVTKDIHEELAAVAVEFTVEECGKCKQTRRFV